MEITKCACGCAWPEMKREHFSGRPDQCYQVQCIACGLSGPATHSEELAKRQWDTLQDAIQEYKEKRTV